MSGAEPRDDFWFWTTAAAIRDARALMVRIADTVGGGSAAGNGAWWRACVAILVWMPR